MRSNKPTHRILLTGMNRNVMKGSTDEIYSGRTRVRGYRWISEGMGVEEKEDII